MSRPDERNPAERAYAYLADEFNEPTTMTLEDFKPELVALAQGFAMAMGFNWPPQTGDFDRYYEWRCTGHTRRTDVQG